MSAGSMFGPAMIEALKQSSFAYVEKLYADAGVKDGMSSKETDRRIAAEHRRRAKRAKKQEAEASFWRAIQRRHARERERGEW